MRYRENRPTKKELISIVDRKTINLFDIEKHAMERSIQTEAKDDYGAAGFLLEFSSPVRDLLLPSVHPTLIGVSVFLDNDDPTGNDWRSLWLELMERVLTKEDQNSLKSHSSGPTQAVLAKWCQEMRPEEATVGRLITALRTIHRNDAADILDDFIDKRDCDGMSVFIENTTILLHSISQAESGQLTKEGLSLEAPDGSCSLAVPEGAVSDPVDISMSPFSDDNEYLSKTGNSLSNVIQILPHGILLKKQATLRLKHHFLFNEHHPPNVTLFHDSGEGKFSALCTLTAMNESTAFKEGTAILLPDQIIVKMKSFCRLCGEGKSRCLNLSAFVFLPIEMPISDFLGGVVMKVGITAATKAEENRWKKSEKELKYECVRAFPLNVCICDLHKIEKCTDEARGAPECKVDCRRSLGIELEMREGNASQLEIGMTPKAIHRSYLQSVKKRPKHFARALDFFISLKSKDLGLTASLSSLAMKITFKTAERVDFEQAIQVKIRNAASDQPQSSLGIEPFISRRSKPLTTKELSDLSVRLCDCWKPFGRGALDISEEVISQIANDYRHQSVSEQAYQMLRSWILKKPDIATVEELVRKLEEYGLTQTAREIFKPSQ
eukprot:m.218846 g.218846  ORF g.218846 m.218846 type:complete len:609 (+) comp39911_c0_seq1:3006-4832(+)